MKKWFVIPLLLIIVGALVFSGCSKSATTPSPSPSPSPATTPSPSPSPSPSPLLPSPSPTQTVTGPKEILFGATVPLSGNLAGFGLGSGWGLKVAVDDINKQGGIFVKEYNRKIPVRLVMVDNVSDPMKAGTLAEDLFCKTR